MAPPPPAAMRQDDPENTLSNPIVMICPACASPDRFEFVESVGDFRVYRCPNCRLEFSQPMRGAGSEYYATSALYDGLREGAFLELAGNHKRFLEQKRLGQTLMDIGCASGIFLKAAQEAGYSVSGIDFDATSIEHARKNHGLQDVHCASLEDFAQRQPQRRYDVATFFEVLEHVENPVLLLETVRRILKPGGVIALSTPNRDRFFYKTRFDFEMDRPPVHLTRWTAFTLRKFLERHGFEILSLEISPLTWRDVAFVFKSKIVFGLAKRVQAKGCAQGSTALVQGASWMMRTKETLLKLAALCVMPSIWLCRGQGYGLFCVARLRQE